MTLDQRKGTELLTPIRIMFFIPDFEDGGAQRQCLLLINELQADPDYEIHLFHLHHGVHGHLLDRRGVTVHTFLVGSNFDPRVTWRLIKVLRKVQPDILISWLHAADVHSFFGSRFVRRTRWIMTERSSRYPNKLRFRLRTWCARFATMIVSNSAAGDLYWVGNGYRGIRHVVPNIVQMTSLRGERRPVREKRIVFAGRLEKQKNPEVVVRAMAHFVERHPDYECQIVGKGSLGPAVEKLISSLDVGARLKMLGFRSDLDEILASCTAVLSLSRWEGTPNVVLESVSLGVPVVLSNIPEHRDFVGARYPFLVDDMDDPQEAAAVLDQVVGASQSDGSSLQYATKQLERMTAASVANSYRNFFDEVLHL